MCNWGLQASAMNIWICFDCRLCPGMTPLAGVLIGYGWKGPFSVVLWAFHCKRMEGAPHSHFLNCISQTLIKTLQSYLYWCAVITAGGRNIRWIKPAWFDCHVTLRIPPFSHWFYSQVTSGDIQWQTLFYTLIEGTLSLVLRKLSKLLNIFLHVCLFFWSVLLCRVQLI